MDKDVRHIEVTEQKIKNRITKFKSLYSIVLIVLVIAQSLILVNIKELSLSLVKNYNSYVEIKNELADVFVKDTVRAQQRIVLSSIRESWVQYLNYYPNTKLLLQDSSGNLIYANMNNESMAFDPQTMSRVKVSDHAYNIIDKNTGKVLLKNARPQWNTEEIKKILDIIAAPVKTFGPSGEIIAFDSYTGEILLSNKSNSDYSYVAENGKRYIALEYKDNKNSEAADELTEQYMQRKDTDRNTQMTSLFAESTEMGLDANDFTKFPLGDYQREFQEKIILPYPSMGVGGEEMQITIVLGSYEKEIMQPYKNVLDKSKQLEKELKLLSTKITMMPFMNALISILILMFCGFGFNLFTAYVNKVCKCLQSNHE